MIKSSELHVFVEGDSSKETILLLHGGPGVPDYLAPVASLHIPAIILYGSYDIYGNSSKLSLDRWPKAEHVILRDAGHLPWIQDQQGFKNALTNFYGRFGSQFAP